MQARTVGAVARDALLGMPTAVIAGETSGGLFLRLPNAWVIFLSSQSPPGPLTVQLPKPLPGGHPAGTILKVDPYGLDFPPPVGRLDLRVAEVWRAPEAQTGDRGLLPAHERAARLAEIARRAASLRPGAGWSALLPGTPQAVQPGLPQAIRPGLDQLRAALARADGETAVIALAELLGLGGGLTPSGDDLALGLVLALSRWGVIWLPEMDHEAFFARVVASARRSSSDLSASLIEAAARGQADPRLIAALDGLACGWPPVEVCAAGLAEWGHSSGLDALLGMSLAVDPYPRKKE